VASSTAAVSPKPSVLEMFAKADQARKAQSTSPSQPSRSPQPAKSPSQQSQQASAKESTTDKVSRHCDTEDLNLAHSCSLIVCTGEDFPERHFDTEMLLQFEPWTLLFFVCIGGDFQERHLGRCDTFMI
jgi:hypothetical protein